MAASAVSSAGGGNSPKIPNIELNMTGDAAPGLYDEQKKLWCEKGPPTIFSVKVEKSLMFDSVLKLSKSKAQGISSVLTVPAVADTLFVECTNPETIVAVLNEVRKSDISKVDELMMPRLLNEIRVLRVSIGRLVRLGNSAYDMDPAQIVDIRGGSVLVKVWPRIDYDELKNRGIKSQRVLNTQMPRDYRPPSVPFDPEKLKEIGAEITTGVMSLGNVQISVQKWDGMDFVGQFEYLELPLYFVLVDEKLKPEEIARFQAGVAPFENENRRFIENMTSPGVSYVRMLEETQTVTVCEPASEKSPANDLLEKQIWETDGSISPSERSTEAVEESLVQSPVSSDDKDTEKPMPPNKDEGAISEGEKLENEQSLTANDGDIEKQIVGNVSISSNDGHVENAVSTNERVSHTSEEVLDGALLGSETVRADSIIANDVSVERQASLNESVNPMNEKPVEGMTRDTEKNPESLSTARDETSGAVIVNDVPVDDSPSKEESIENANKANDKQIATPAYDRSLVGLDASDVLVEGPVSMSEKPLEAPATTEEKHLEGPILTNESPLRNAVPTEEKPVENLIPTNENPVESPILTNESPLRNAVPTEEKPVDNLIPTSENPVESPILTNESPLRNAVPTEEKSIESLIPTRGNPFESPILTNENPLEGAVPTEEKLIESLIPTSEKPIECTIPVEDKPHASPIPTNDKTIASCPQNEKSLTGADSMNENFFGAPMLSSDTTQITNDPAETDEPAPQDEQQTVSPLASNSSRPEPVQEQGSDVLQSSTQINEDVQKTAKGVDDLPDSALTNEMGMSADAEQKEQLSTPVEPEASVSSPPHKSTETNQQLPNILEGVYESTPAPVTETPTPISPIISPNLSNSVGTDEHEQRNLPSSTETMSSEQTTNNDSAEPMREVQGKSMESPIEQISQQTQNTTEPTLENEEKLITTTNVVEEPNLPEAQTDLAKTALPVLNTETNPADIDHSMKPIATNEVKSIPPSQSMAAAGEALPIEEDPMMGQTPPTESNVPPVALPTEGSGSHEPELSHETVPSTQESVGVNTAKGSYHSEEGTSLQTTTTNEVLQINVRLPKTVIGFPSSSNVSSSFEAREKESVLEGQSRSDMPLMEEKVPNEMSSLGTGDVSSELGSSVEEKTPTGMTLPGEERHWSELRSFAEGSPLLTEETQRSETNPITEETLSTQTSLVTEEAPRNENDIMGEQRQSMESSSVTQETLPVTQETQQNENDITGEQRQPMETSSVTQETLPVMQEALHHEKDIMREQRQSMETTSVTEEKPQNENDITGEQRQPMETSSVTQETLPVTEEALQNENDLMVDQRQSMETTSVTQETEEALRNENDLVGDQRQSMETSSMTEEKPQNENDMIGEQRQPAETSPITQETLPEEKPQNELGIVTDQKLQNETTSLTEEISSPTQEEHPVSFTEEPLLNSPTSQDPSPETYTTSSTLIEPQPKEVTEIPPFTDPIPQQTPFTNSPSTDPSINTSSPIPSTLELPSETQDTPNSLQPRPSSPLDPKPPAKTPEQATYVEPPLPKPDILLPSPNSSSDQNPWPLPDVPFDSFGDPDQDATQFSPPSSTLGDLLNLIPQTSDEELLQASENEDDLDFGPVTQGPLPRPLAYQELEARGFPPYFDPFERWAARPVLNPGDEAEIIHALYEGLHVRIGAVDGHTVSFHPIGVFNGSVTDLAKLDASVYKDDLSRGHVDVSCQTDYRPPMLRKGDIFRWAGEFVVVTDVDKDSQTIAEVLTLQNERKWVDLGTQIPMIIMDDSVSCDRNRVRICRSDEVVDQNGEKWIVFRTWQNHVFCVSPQNVEAVKIIRASELAVQGVEPPAPPQPPAVEQRRMPIQPPVPQIQQNRPRVPAPELQKKAPVQFPKWIEKQMMVLTDDSDKLAVITKADTKKGVIFVQFKDGDKLDMKSKQYQLSQLRPAPYARGDHVMVKRGPSGSKRNYIGVVVSMKGNSVSVKVEGGNEVRSSDASDVFRYFSWEWGDD